MKIKDIRFWPLEIAVRMFVRAQLVLKEIERYKKEVNVIDYGVLVVDADNPFLRYGIDYEKKFLTLIGCVVPPQLTLGEWTVVIRMDKLLYYPDHDKQLIRFFEIQRDTSLDPEWGSYLHSSDNENMVYLPYHNWHTAYEPGRLYEIYGKDWDEVNRAHPDYVWTLLDDDHVINKKQFVNRVGYYITKYPCRCRVVDVIPEHVLAN